MKISDDWKDHLRVVLVATRNPLNIGAAARAMANFGFSRLRVVNPYDVAFREARSAVGAAPLLGRPKTSRAWPMRWPIRLVVGTTSVGHRELHHPLRRLEYGARLMRRGLRQAPVALLFGSEKFGLSNEDLSHCHWLMRIPTVDRDLSMNLGQAVALCLYELARDPKAVDGAPSESSARRRRRTNKSPGLLVEALRQRLREPGDRGIHRREGAAHGPPSEYCRARRAGDAGHAAADSVEGRRVVPRQVTVPMVAVFLFAAAAAAAVVGAALLVPGALLDWLRRLNQPGMSAFVALGWISGVLLLTLGAGTLAAGAGLLRRRRTGAWWFAVVLFAINAAGDVVSVWATGDWLRSACGAAISSAFLCSLIRPRVRRYFQDTG